MLLHCGNRRMLPIILGITLGTILILITIRPQYLHTTTSYVQHLASSGRTRDHSSPSHSTKTQQEVPLQPEQPSAHHQQQEHTANTTSVTSADKVNNTERFHLVKSLSGPDGAYVDIDFRGRKGYNPSIIPHPMLTDKWIAVAMQHQFWSEDIHSGFKAQMVCLASWKDGRIVCDDPPTSFSTRPTMSGNCDVPDFPMVGMVALSVGAHDPRVFFGPENPYIVYGSLSNYDNTVCLGQWIQDFRVLVEWGPFIGPWIDFGISQELARPPPTSPIEKNYFVFWDSQNVMYTHYDLAHQRSFARVLNAQGEVGLDLGNVSQLNNETLARQNNLTSTDVELYTKSADSDAKCWKHWMESAPLLAGAHIHQATNSLSVTLCSPKEDGEENCKVSDENTFLMHIFQAKTIDPKVNHGEQTYDPYVVLMKRSAPFGIHAVSRLPLRFVEPTKEEQEKRRLANEKLYPLHSRQQRRETTHQEQRNSTSQRLRRDDGSDAQREESRELLYVTSMNWKEKDKYYHGFIDDVIFIGFGRSDRENSMVDVTPRELIGELLMC